MTPAFVLAVTMACSSSPAPPPPLDLAWSQLAGTDLEVFVRLDGQVKRLTMRDGADFAGPVSPAGDALVVIHSSQQDDHLTQRLWLHPVDGTAPVALSEAASLVRSPRWTTDGTAVVYESSHNSFRDLYRATPAGAITRLSRSDHGCFEPAPLGDGGTVIAPCSGRDVDLYRLSDAASPTGPLLAREGEDGAPAVSPDQQTVAFLAAEGAAIALHALTLDDLTHRRVWAPVGDVRIVPDQGVHWSPDGTHIAVVTRTEDGVAHIVVVAADTGAVVMQTAGDLPSWAPDGSLLVTHEDDDGQGVFRVSAAGGSAVRVAPPGSWLGRPVGG